MRPSAFLFLAAQNLLAASNPGAPQLSQDRFTFCHDADYPLTAMEARWCPLVGDHSSVCPTLPAACSKPPSSVDLEATLGGGNGRAGSGGDTSSQPADNGDGDAEGRAARSGGGRTTVRSRDGDAEANGSAGNNGNSSGRNGSTGGTSTTEPPPPKPTSQGDSATGSPPTSRAPEPKPPPQGRAAPPAEPPPPPVAQGMSLFAQILLFLIVGLGLALVIRAIAKHLSWRKKKDEEPEEALAAQTEAETITPERRGPVETDVERLLRRAQEAANRGDFTRAVEDAYAALLRRLDGAGLIEIHPSRTNGDYVRALRERPELRANVREIVRDVERVQFGSDAPSAHLFRAIFDRIVPIATRALGAIAILFAASVLTSCDDPPDTKPASGGSTRPYGTAALDAVLKERGRDVIHRTASLASIEGESHDKALVLLRGADLDETTWRSVIAWTNEGGILVVAGLRHLPLELTAEPTDDDSAEIKLDRAGELDYRQRFADLSIFAPPGTKLRTTAGPSDWLLRRGDEPYAVRARVGKGRAYVFAERALFTNIAFTVGDNAAFAVELLDDLGRDDIEICDMWTGAGAGNPLQAMDGANLTPVILQLLAMALLFLVWRGAHFGEPRDPLARSRRAFADHVRALGHIYHRASASEHALGNFAAWSIERLRERYYRGTKSGLLPLAEAIAARTGRDEAEVTRVLVEAQSARDSSGPPSSFRPSFRYDAKPPPKGSTEERDMRLIRALFEFLRTSKERPKGSRASKSS